jgi:hypothetical protein
MARYFKAKAYQVIEVALSTIESGSPASVSNSSPA